MNISDETEIKKNREKNNRVDEKYNDDVKNLLNMPSGRRFIWMQLVRCGIYEESAVSSGSWTYYNEGKRAIGLQILADIMKADDEKYLVMIRENKKGV